VTTLEDDHYPNLIVGHKESVEGNVKPLTALQRYIAVARARLRMKERSVREYCDDPAIYTDDPMGWEKDKGSTWPYTVPRQPWHIPEEHRIGHPKPSSDSRFNLIHGFMWGRHDDS
jgi:hypothetical protein